MLCSPGNLPGDSEVRWSVSRNLLIHGTPAIEADVQTRNYATGKDGKRYSVWGLGQVLCFIPFAGAAALLGRFTPVSPATADMVGQFAAGVIFFPVVGALGVWLFYRLIILLGYPAKTSMLTAGLLGLATMHFHYAIVTHEQSQVELLIILALILMIKSVQTGSFSRIWLLGLVLGCAMLFRMGSVLLALPIFATGALAQIIRKDGQPVPAKTAKWFLAGLMGTGPFLFIMGWYNYIRFGDVFENGYRLCTATALGGHGIFESQPLPTLAAMLFSPGKSIFLYNPVLLLVPFCLVAFYRRHRIIAVAILLGTAANFLFHSFHTTWAGDYAWGTRYEVPVLPLLVLPLVIIFHVGKRWMKRTIMGVITLSIVIQFASVLYNFNLEFTQNGNHCIIPDSYVWDWRQSQLVQRFVNIGRHIIGHRTFQSVPVTQPEPLLLKIHHSREAVQKAYSINFFPFKARAFGVSVKLYKMLLGLWCVIFILWAGSAIKLLKTFRICNTCQQD